MIAKVARSIRKRTGRLLGAPLRPEELLRRKTIARAFLRGEGIEIGALHNPLKVPRHARVKYVNRISHVELAKEHPELRSKLVRVDIVDDGETLAAIPDSSQDFVIANHFVEHCQDPIGALRNMLRVLRRDGVLFLAIPDNRCAFDADRPVTPIEHLLRDDREGPSWSRRQHYEEWTRLVDKVPDDAEAERHAEELMSRQAPIRYHAWSQVELLELICALRRLHTFEVELIFKRNNEVIFILRKSDEEPAAARAAQWSTEMPVQRQRARVWQRLADVFKNGVRGAPAPAREPIDLPQSAPDATPLRLNLGCNRNPKPGFINVDIQPFPGVDVVADLEKPWPWKDGTFDEIVCTDLPEHLRQWYEEPEPAALERARRYAVSGHFGEAIDSVIQALRRPQRHYGVIHFMEEAHRVLRPYGRLDCTIPSTEGRGWAQDPTHVSYWNENSVLYFLDGELGRNYPSLIRRVWRRVSVETLKPDRHGVIWFRMVLQKEPHDREAARTS